MEQRKLMVTGIPWDVDNEGLKEYMSKFGDLEDCYVIKERSTGRSRGFGYVTFTSLDDAKKVLSSEHILGNRMLEVKVATPKGRGSKPHRGIGFITFASADSVESLMKEIHELGGSDLVVDRATPKEDDFKPIGRTRTSQGGYGAYNNAYISAPTRYEALGAPTMYDHPSSIYGRGEPVRGMSKKIFVGHLPPEATTEDLRLYFGRFGHILDVYIPRDVNKSGHRGFGFVTFADYGVADHVSQRSHEICGHQVAIDSAAPLDYAGPSGNTMVTSMDSFRAYGAPARPYFDQSPARPYFDQSSARPYFDRSSIRPYFDRSSIRPYFDRSSVRPYVDQSPVRPYGRMYDNLDLDNWGYGVASRRPSRADWRYRPY
ncbi:uncharacterized protein LOC131624698 isoform X2 [Vicia villosa]|uniref:uncharacterized protein LOC131624698 isoform X2 n=1 Tax=Vicia villosa TaxID=3911 RepID=UPI00273C82BB|nr:uncharacterized protein LOC131624698 isoform X2 [Vicia villosa]